MKSLACLGIQDCLQGIDWSVVNAKQSSLSLSPLAFHISPTTGCLVVTLKLLAQNPAMLPDGTLAPAMTTTTLPGAMSASSKHPQQFLQHTLHVVLTVRDSWKQSLSWNVFDTPVVSKMMSSLPVNMYLYGLQALSTQAIYTKKPTTPATSTPTPAVKALPSLKGPPGSTPLPIAASVAASQDGVSLDMKDNVILQYQCSTGSNVIESNGGYVSATRRLGFPRLFAIQPIEVNKGTCQSLISCLI